jgi:DNA-binding PucR family transcriptional regulator
LLVHRDEALLEDVRRRALAPLEELRGTTRGRLEDTLRAYLDHAGRMEPTAHALGVHPQTVRYRVSQLRDLLGAALDTADGRLMLAVALRARDRRSRDRVR